MYMYDIYLFIYVLFIDLLIREREREILIQVDNITKVPSKNGLPSQSGK